MKITTVRHGLAAISLTAADCHQLASACDHAANTGSPDADALETLGAAFQALAIAAYTQLDTPVSNLTPIAAHLHTLGLSPNQEQLQ